MLGRPSNGEATYRDNLVIAQDSHAILLAHHGLIVGGRDLDDAVNNAEELEETARLFLLLRDKPYRTLNAQQVSELEKAFPRKL